MKLYTRKEVLEMDSLLKNLLESLLKIMKEEKEIDPRLAKLREFKAED